MIILSLTVISLKIIVLCLLQSKIFVIMNFVKGAFSGKFGKKVIFFDNVLQTSCKRTWHFENLMSLVSDLFLSTCPHCVLYIRRHNLMVHVIVLAMKKCQKLGNLSGS